jgi:hypothetical protein
MTAGFDPVAAPALKVRQARPAMPGFPPQSGNSGLEHLGHSSSGITADIYSHVAPEQRREAADRLDEALEW